MAYRTGNQRALQSADFNGHAIEEEANANIQRSKPPGQIKSSCEAGIALLWSLKEAEERRNSLDRVARILQSGTESIPDGRAENLKHPHQNLSLADQLQ